MNVMTKRGSIDNVVTYEHYCDRVSDLQNIPRDQITLGSVAIVLKNENDELEVYMATTGKEWVPLLENANNSEDSSGLDLIHICNSNEYDSTSKIPTLENPEENIIYLVQTSNNSGNLYDEWIYVNNSWESFGSGSVNLDWSNITGKPAISVGTGTSATIENAATSASGEASHAEGNRTQATASGAHAEGGATEATGINSHAEGGASVASGRNAHAEGTETTASGDYSHAEGSGTVAYGSTSHAAGTNTTANGQASYAGGINTESSGYASVANGVNTIANHRSQVVFGDYNVADNASSTNDNRGNYIEIVGNGTSSARSNARTLDWNGNEVLAGKLTVGSDPTNNMDVATKQYVDTIASGNSDGAGVFFVTITGTPGEYTSDKTLSEIEAAISNGSYVVAHFNDFSFINAANSVEPKTSPVP